jgi:hypothetical protein
MPPPPVGNGVLGPVLNSSSAVDTTSITLALANSLGAGMGAGGGSDRATPTGATLPSSDTGFDPASPPASTSAPFGSFLTPFSPGGNPPQQVPSSGGPAGAPAMPQAASPTHSHERRLLPRLWQGLMPDRGRRVAVGSNLPPEHTYPQASGVLTEAQLPLPPMAPGMPTITSAGYRSVSQTGKLEMESSRDEYSHNGSLCSTAVASPLLGAGLMAAGASNYLYGGASKAAVPVGASVTVATRLARMAELAPGAGPGRVLIFHVRWSANVVGGAASCSSAHRC